VNKLENINPGLEDYINTDLKEMVCGDVNYNLLSENWI